MEESERKAQEFQKRAEYAEKIVNRKDNTCGGLGSLFLSTHYAAT